MIGSAGRDPPERFTTVFASSSRAMPRPGLARPSASRTMSSLAAEEALASATDADDSDHPARL